MRRTLQAGAGALIECKWFDVSVNIAVLKITLRKNPQKTKN